MSKDPAMLLYTADFLVGVAFMSMHERGQYITLICLQHQKGHMDISCMESAVGSLSNTVLSHFKQDEDGLYYNERAEAETLKRKAYSESRRQNRSNPNKSSSHDSHMKNICNTYVEHMENENVNEDANKDRDKTADYAKSIISYLNGKAGTAYRATSEKTKKLIGARINEGFMVEDFYTVIDNKVEEWGKPPKPGQNDMRQYIRPVTLFGTKFESYLNQRRVSNDGEHERIGEHLI